MDTHKIDFYSKLGILATLFANLEHHAEEVLSRLIDKNDILLTKTLIEDFPFYKRIEMIKKLAKFRSSFKGDLENIAGQMNDIRKTRNYFVHGLWATPIEGETGYYVSVEIPKLNIEKTDGGHHWFTKSEVFTKGQLEQLISRIELIINMAKKIAVKLYDDEDLI